MNKLTIFETFVGAGGSHLGFKQNGFKSVFVNDISKDCIDTLLYNNPEIKKTAIISIEDMTTINPSELRKKMKMEKKDLDTMFGGIVCKGFSLAGERSPNDPRNVFYHYQLDFVKEFLFLSVIVQFLQYYYHSFSDYGQYRKGGFQFGQAFASHE